MSLDEQCILRSIIARIMRHDVPRLADSCWISCGEAARAIIDGLEESYSLLYGSCVTHGTGKELKVAQ